MEENIISHQKYIFWLDDLKVLYRDNEYLNFIPTSSMSRVEQLNAVSRFCIYLLILIVLIDHNNPYIHLPILVLFLCVILYNIFNNDENGKRDEVLRMKRGEKLSNISSQKNPSQTLEAEYYDSSGKLSGITPDVNIGASTKYSMDEMRLYEQAKCRVPTVDNPMMNPSIEDFNTLDPPVACNADNEDIKNEIEKKFSKDIYKDIDDVFDKKNSQRQFFTVPHNIPNDQEAFGRWCYNFPDTCKTNQERCLRYEDCRFKYQ